MTIIVVAERSPTVAALCTAIRARGIDCQVHSWVEVYTGPVLMLADAVLVVIGHSAEDALERAVGLRHWPVGFVDPGHLAWEQLVAALQLGPVLGPWWTPFELEQVLDALLSAPFRRRFPAGSVPPPVVDVSCGIHGLRALRRRHAFIVVRDRPDLRPGVGVVLRLRLPRDETHVVSARVVAVDNDPVHGATSFLDPYGIGDQLAEELADDEAG